MINAIEQIVKERFGCDAIEIRKFENVPNNSVFSFQHDDQAYVFKLYRSRYWPEDGKLQFVNRLLLKQNIPCAELIAFTRDHPEFPNGYLIEREIKGSTAEKLQFDRSGEIAFYEKLAGLVSNVHRIPVKGFGYMGGGEGISESMHSFFEDEFDERIESLVEKGIFAETELLELKKILLDTLKRFEDLPSVLCHGDLSQKNVIIREDGRLVLIDWDDAMAYNWMADIARFTFWMKMHYGEREHELFRNAFLQKYDGLRKEEFGDFEKAFHIYVSLDVLNYAINAGDSGMERFSKAYAEELREHFLRGGFR